MRIAPLLFLLIFTCCSQQEKAITKIQGVAMTIPYRITLGEPLTYEEQKRLKEQVEAIFSRVNAVYNIYNPDSELSKINQAAAGERLPLSNELASLFVLADRVYHETGGLYDPTVLTVQTVWRRHLKEGNLPPQSELKNLEDAVGWNQVQFEEHTLTKAHSRTQIDLGGIAKGLCVDMIADALQEAGADSCLVDWGGEIATRGDHPSGRPWRLFISHLGNPDPGEAVAIVEMDNNAIATSGDYLQHWQAEGKRYTHIIHPFTKKPLEITDESIASVSVQASSCAYADALATAMMLFTDEEITAFQENHPDIHVWTSK